MEREIEDIGARETEKGIEGKIFKRKRERLGETMWKRKRDGEMRGD